MRLGVNLHYCGHFIKHYWGATRVDVLHSPFVFDLYNFCIKSQPSDENLVKIRQLRKSLLSDKRELNQMDLGAGGIKKQIKHYTVAQLVQLHAKPLRISAILYFIVKKFSYQYIVELGTSLGLSSAHIGMALKSASNSKFTSIEGSGEIAAIAEANIEKLDAHDKVTIIKGNFDDTLPIVLSQYDKIDMAFIDGNHRYEPTLNYFYQFLEKIHNDSVLIFDDIYWSKGMTRAWEEIKQDPRVTVTVDLFFIGLVFFRKEQTKQHFKLRVL